MSTNADVEPDMERDEDTPAERTQWMAAFVVLVLATSAVVAVTFALSFYGLEDFGRTGMGLPRWLSPFVPIGVDLFSLCGIAATYLLRRAEWRVQLYAWCVFLVPSGLSVAGNIAHAEHRGLATPGVVGAAVAPVILALATHLVVVVRREVEKRSQADTEADTDYDANEPVSGPPEMFEADTDEVAAMARALAVRQRGGTVAAQAAAAGVSPRTVRRWFGQPAKRPPARPARRRSAAPDAPVLGARADTFTDSRELELDGVPS